MPEFMDIHTGMVGVTPEALAAAHAADLAIQDEEHVRFVRTWADPDRDRLLPVRGAHPGRGPAHP